ncbi:MAG: hypothetical protein IT198_00525 [Acidimicrobiia bacterium]|nr:hypothetical protein [Acidimicrobiia bacterium]
MQLETHVIEGRGNPDRLMFLVHGYYSQPYALSTLGPLVDPDAHYLVMAPRGPHPLPPHDSYWIEPGGGDDRGFLDVLEALDALVGETCSARGFDRGDTVVGGFSQGAGLALALALGATERTRVAGVMCLSGFMPDVEGLVWDLDGAREVAVLVQHGTDDTLIPVARGRDIAAHVRDAGLDVTYGEYPAGHDITLEGLVDMRAWLARITP